MKLVQLLAKELKEWPNGVDVYAQDTTGSVFPWIGSPDHDGEQWIVSGAAGVHMGASLVIGGYSACDDHMTANVTKSQWQAEREKMNKPKWIRHRGGNSTLHPGTMVEARLRSGEIQRAIAGAFLWDNSLSDHAVNIMAYRVIEETKDQEIEEVKKTNFGTLTYNIEVDTSSAMTAINELSAKWGQIESPLKWRDEIIELEAYEEEFRRKREKLIRKLESEGFKLIDHMAPVYGEAIIDFSDWRNWQTGDIVECLTDEFVGTYDKGAQYVVEFVNESGFGVFDNFGESSSCDWSPEEAHLLKFINRQ